ncbi:MAG: DMT family transporter [Candidatus Gracilibacteria bacterium]
MKKQEKIGIIFILISAALVGLFPVVVNRVTQTVPPITFAALSALFAAVGLFIYSALTGKLHELKQKKAYFPVLMVTILIVIIPYTLFSIGASQTSGINSSILPLSEIIFTLIVTPFFGEKTTFKKIFGALGIFVGAFFLLYNGSFQFNHGDFLIIASTITYPFGSFYTKKALNLISPSIILCVRFALGGLFMLMLARVFEPATDLTEVFSLHWGSLLLTGFVFLGIAKIISHEALKRLDISKTISLLMTSPLFSLIILIVFFKEIPSAFQWIGIGVMAIGVYFSIKRPSVDPALTKYGPAV